MTLIKYARSLLLKKVLAALTLSQQCITIATSDTQEIQLCNATVTATHKKD